MEAAGNAGRDPRGEGNAVDAPWQRRKIEIHFVSPRARRTPHIGVWSVVLVHATGYITNYKYSTLQCFIPYTVGVPQYAGGVLE